MIKDILDQISRYSGIIPKWEMFLELLAIDKLKEMDVGQYDLEDGDSYFMITKYQTRSFHKTQFEFHRKFVDIQIILEGIELIYTAPTSRTIADVHGYDSEKDIQFGEASVPDVLMLKAGDFAVFYPEDAHNPCCSVGKHPINVKKAVFKILLQNVG